jgi:hypothetical protein
MWKRSSTHQKLENGGQAKQRRKKIGADNCPFRVLRKELQNGAKQTKDLVF